MNSSTVTQSDGTKLVIRPGDILWKASGELIHGSLSGVEVNDAVMALMYLGRPAASKRLVFTAFSVSRGILSRNKHKYTIIISNYTIKVNRGTIKNAIRNMRDMSKHYHAVINKNKDIKKQYSITQELYSANVSQMTGMQLVQSGTRISDMMEWPWHSLFWWGRHVLCLKGEANLKMLRGLNTNESLIMDVRKLTASNGNKKNVHKPKAEKIKNVNSNHVGLLPDNPPLSGYDRSNNVVGANPNIKSVIQHALSRGSNGGKLHGIRWVKLRNPTYIDEYVVRVEGDIPTSIIEERVVILDHNNWPRWITASIETRHHTKAILKVESNGGRKALGIFVLTYEDQILSWSTTTPSDGRYLSSIATYFDEEAVDLEPIGEAPVDASPIEPISAPVPERSLSRVIVYRPQGLDLHIRYNNVSGSTQVYPRGNMANILLHRGLPSMLSNSDIRDRLLGIDWRQLIEDSNTTTRDSVETTRDINFRPYGFSFVIHYNEITGVAQIHEPATPNHHIITRTIAPGMTDSRIFRYLDDMDINWQMAIDQARPREEEVASESPPPVYASGCNEVRDFEHNPAPYHFRIRYEEQNRRVIVYEPGSMSNPILTTQMPSNLTNNAVIHRLRNVNWTSALQAHYRTGTTVPAPEAAPEETDSEEIAAPRLSPNSNVAIGWAVRNSSNTSIQTPPLVMDCKFVYTTPESVLLQVEYVGESGALIVYEEGYRDNPLIDVRIATNLDAGRVMTTVQGHDWARQIEHTQAHQDTPATNNTYSAASEQTMVVVRPIPTGHLRAEYYPISGTLRITRSNRGSNERTPLIEEQIEKGLNRTDIGEMLLHIDVEADDSGEDE